MRRVPTIAAARRRCGGSAGELLSLQGFSTLLTGSSCEAKHMQCGSAAPPRQHLVARRIELSTGAHPSSPIRRNPHRKFLCRTCKLQVCGPAGRDLEAVAEHTPTHHQANRQRGHPPTPTLLPTDSEQPRRVSGNARTGAVGRISRWWPRPGESRRPPSLSPCD